MGKSVLIIDDEEGIRKVLGIAMSDAGYTVYTAERAKDGLELFHLHRPTLVLMDLIMPGRGGCEALRVIKEECPDTPVILLSGMSGQEARALCHDYPEVIFLSKPVDARTLEAAIAQSLSHTVHSPSADIAPMSL